MSELPTDRVTVENAPEHVERRSIVVDAEPSAIFDLLADPARHADFDGSGTVKGNRIGPDRLALGARFGMQMKQYGVPYRMTSEVVEFEEDELIAWRHYGRHVWRYRLEAAPGGTRVTEEFDWRPSISRLGLKLIKAPQGNAAAIEQTLVRLAALVEG